MTTKNQEITNIIKISSASDILLRREGFNTISLTRMKDEIVLDTFEKDVKPLYYDEAAAKLFMTSPEYRKGIFPVDCGERKIEVICGQDECQAYVQGESQPISVLPPTITDPPEECPDPPCIPCPQPCSDGSCPPCDPPPQPCPCQSTGLAPLGSFFPNCPPNPCGAVCPCPDGGCPPCDGGCECPDCVSPCPDGGCPPCDGGGCEAGCAAAGDACCMCNQAGHCLTVTTLQWGFTIKGIECPIGQNGIGDEAEPVFPGGGDPEFICGGGNCNCPCETSDQICNKAAPGAAMTTTLDLCATNTRRYCTTSGGSSTSMSFTNPTGGEIILDPSTGLLDPTGINFDDLDNPRDTIIEGGEGQSDTQCGERGSGVGCFCGCCSTPDPDDCPPGSIPCFNCSDDTTPAAPRNKSMCESGGTNIIYRQMCSGGDTDHCAILANNGLCLPNTSNCQQIPVIIISWQPDVSVTPIVPEQSPPGGLIDGFDIVVGGNPIGGPGAMGACNCEPYEGSGTSSSDFDELYPGLNDTEKWSDNRIRDCD